MVRSISRVSQGENQTRIVAKLEGNPCSAETLDGYKEMVGMLRTVADQPDLLRTETMCPESVRMYHNGSFWIIESVSSVIKPIADEY